jgi:hypothetical protein
MTRPAFRSVRRPPMPPVGSRECLLAEYRLEAIFGCAAGFSTRLYPLAAYRVETIPERAAGHRHRKDLGLWNQELQDTGSMAL